MSFSVDRKRIQKYPENSPIPLVIVEGFLGGTGALLWGSFEAHMNLGSELARKVLFAKWVSFKFIHILTYVTCSGQCRSSKLPTRQSL